MSNAVSYRGDPPQPVRYRGVEYPSKNACYRQAGISQQGLDAAIRRGEAVLLTPAPPATSQSGAEGAAKRIARAARKIRDINQAQIDELAEDGTRVEIAGRRMALVKALHLYRLRYGQGVTDVVREV